MIATLSDTAAPEPVIAEIVPPAPSPWRFGLKALLGLMVVCSVQFAAMNWLGILEGLVAGGFVCFAAFGAIVVAAPFLTGERARLLPQLDAIIVRLMLAIVILVVGTILAGGGTAVWMVATRIQTERLVEQKLGLSLKEVTVMHNNRVVSALHIAAVTDGGAAHDAGIQKDDVIVLEGTVGETIEMLYANRGKDVDLNLATGAVSRPIESCPQRSVTVAVPP
jgi:hypothetical protein